MSEMEPELDPMLASLFDVEKQRPDPLPDAWERVMSRVATTVSVPVGPFGLGGGAVHAGPKAVSWLSGPARWLSGGLVVGGLVGAVGHAKLARPEIKTVTVIERVEVPAPLPAAPAQVANEAPTASVAASAHATVVLPAPHTPSSARTEPLTRDVDLASERAILEVARTSLSRGKSAMALEALGDHERQFPHGQLVEEREALAIQALAQSGRGPQARDRAARFRRTFPESILLPAVDAALATIP